ncbi:MAG: class I mannose-6-phosphate isomerase [Allosphingosinicella sp.]|uniref:class I mannose-6-phosphate isomerase n=1 Tax=Allosphingosinicella sp. TaxID=2823234 RepID=UPI0039575FA8
MKLKPIQVEKPWGRTRLPPPFATEGERRIGEIWFEGPAALPLLVKYIFTSEKLSVQVHPDDDQARARGHAGGKNECWYILDADPGARLGLGVREEMDAATLRAAALDGSIERRMDWKEVKPGDVFYVPAGTIHAIGGGISLIEVQQSNDITYRLYDYGRARELHLDDAVAVARARPYAPAGPPSGGASGGRVLVNGSDFSLVQVDDPRSDPMADRRRWVVPLRGTAAGGGAGECLLIEAGAKLTLGTGAAALVAAEGPLD